MLQEKLGNNSIFRPFDPLNEVEYWKFLEQEDPSRLQTEARLQMWTLIEEHVWQLGVTHKTMSLNSEGRLTPENGQIPISDLLHRAANRYRELNPHIAGKSVFDLQLEGFEKIDNAFRNGANLAFWISPCLKGEPGYEDYSVIYVYHKIDDHEVVFTQFMSYANENSLKNLHQQTSRVLGQEPQLDVNATAQDLLLSPITAKNSIDLDFFLQKIEKVPQGRKVVITPDLISQIEEYLKLASLPNPSQESLKKQIIGIVNLAHNLSEGKTEQITFDMPFHQMPHHFIPQGFQVSGSSCPSLRNNNLSALMTGKATVKENGDKICPICGIKLDASGYCSLCNLSFN
jgi:hypothetical protein